MWSAYLNIEIQYLVREMDCKQVWKVTLQSFLQHTSDEEEFIEGPLETSGFVLLNRRTVMFGIQFIVNHCFETDNHSLRNHLSAIQNVSTLFPEHAAIKALLLENLTVDLAFGRLFSWIVCP